MRWDLMWIHIFLMLRLVDDGRAWGEQARGAHGSTYLAIYYDELHRLNVSARADRGDEELSLYRAFGKIDKDCLSLATSKLGEVLSRSGIRTRGGQALSTSPSD